MSSDSESRAFDRSEPGGNPIYNGPSKDAINGWRLPTPPIVENLDETLEEVLARQAGRRE